jgi:alkanesulfonate monooxygenase SsuD/methylene tetrahydromethanopterin reductase-like flavin-dependent oxidoreductase (luciferase family)
VIAGDEAELGRRKRALLDGMVDEGEGEAWLASREDRWIFGTPERCREMVARFEAAGIDRLMLQDWLPRELDMVDLMGEELVRQLS